MDKSWMNAKKFSKEHVDGVNGFMRFVEERLGKECKIRCPCELCLNSYIKTQEEVKNHLLHPGIDKDYTRWIYHGERSEFQFCRSSNRDYEEDDDGADNDIDLSETGGDDGIHDMLQDLGNFMQNFDRNEGTSNSSEKLLSDPPKSFTDLLNEAREELYPGCLVYSKLSFIVKLLHLKVYNKWSNKSFDMLLEVFRQVMPKGETIPKSYYEAKNMLRELGLGYVPIHACKYDCALFWKEHENCQTCPECGTSRWKVNDGKGKKIPHKILRYFPLKPRLQRLFMSSKTAENMRWHKDKRINDETLLSHPADSKAWKDFDKEHHWFALDPRNVRLGLATDGFNPFGNMSNAYSMWPVILVPYNLPPWQCMKEPFFMMSLLIPGPQSPGKDIDVYMRPLIDELKELWGNGLETYDASCGQNFQMHAAVLWTINDFPAYGSLSGWSTKGYLACPVCNKRTFSRKLRGKICYMGHRQYLPSGHDWRKRSKQFDGTTEYSLPPDEVTGEDILQQLSFLQQKKSGKHPNNKKRKRGIEELNWTKKSILFDLPYWHTLKLRHNLDVMHIEKNICENILCTLLGIIGKTKDTVKARQDLEDMNIRKELHLKKSNNGSYTMPPARYTMSKKERQEFCTFLKAVKFPDGYASNISRCVNVEEGKVSGLKSHDCHVFLQRLLPVGVRGCLDKDIANALAELGEFFKKLCCKSLRSDDLQQMEKDIAVILCKLEMIFPPAFFDVMVHLAIHLPNEAKLGGPVQYRWMFPIERFLGTLKSYVRNKARPEGSIAEAYIENECLTFCSMYLRGIETRFNREDRNQDISEDGGLSIFSHKLRPIGAPKYVVLPKTELEMAQWYIMNNCEELKSYIEEHKNRLEQESVVLLEHRHKDQFPHWFKQRMSKLRINNSPEATDGLCALACGPDISVNKYPGCIVNGVRFHTKEHDNRRKSQNSGLIVEGYHGDGLIHFFGQVIDIIELLYVKGKRVVLFKCNWFDTSNKRSSLQLDGNLMSLNVSRMWYQDDPFVLADQAKQVFYLNDSKLGNDWQVVQQFQHRHIFSVEEMQGDDMEGDGILNLNDQIYQDDGISNDGDRIQVVGLELPNLSREDDVPAIIDELVVEGYTDDLVFDDYEAEDETLDEYNEDEDQHEVINDDDSDIEHSS